MKKNILAENMRRFKTKNLNEKTWAPGLGSGVLDTGGMSGHQGSGISDGDKMMQRLHGDPKWDINVNYVQIDTNFHDVTMQKQGTLDSHFLEEVLGDLEAYLEDQNITGDDGKSAYDVTRFVSDIKLDCEIKIGKDEIDLTIELDLDGGIKRIDIGDEPLAEKHGITDESVMKHLEAKGI